MTRKMMKAGVAGAALMLCAGLQRAVLAAPKAPVDLLIKGGQVYTGDLKAPKIADIGVSGDKIVFVGDATKAGLRAAKTLDARGMMVTPGFIDAHVHADELKSQDPAQRLLLRQLTQGVTTSVIGVDGEGAPDVAGTLSQVSTLKSGQNIATYVGFGAIRMAVLGEDARAPKAAELDAEKALAAKAMCQGALGLSSGLFYAPQSFAAVDEVIAVAKEAGRRGGLYDTHQRDEGESTIGVMPSLEEAIRIGRESGATLHLAHIKFTSSAAKPNPEAMTQMIRLIDEARAKGQKVTADQYPWAAANTGLVAAVIPRWAQDGGREAMLKRFDNPADVARIKAESSVAKSGAERITINGAPNQPELVGKRLSDIAAGWGVDPTEAAMRILKGDNASVSVFVMTEHDIKLAMVQPWVMTSSDGRSGGHPRAYASYPRLWNNYVIDQKVITPVQFVHRSTGFAADTLGLTGRGYIKPGYFADIAVIDPKSYQAKATFEQPRLLSTGVVDVVVNGQLEIEAGKPTGIQSGRGLAKSPPTGTCPKA